MLAFESHLWMYSAMHLKTDQTGFLFLERTAVHSVEEGPLALLAMDFFTARGNGTVSGITDKFSKAVRPILSNSGTSLAAS